MRCSGDPGHLERSADVRRPRVEPLADPSPFAPNVCRAARVALRNTLDDSPIQKLRLCSPG